MSRRGTRGRGGLRSLACVGVLCAGLAACGQDESGSAGASGSGDDTIKIGMVQPFSGPFGTSSQASKNTYDIAVADLNEKGGIDGRKVELVVKDTKGQPNLAVQYTRELMDEGVRIFVHGTTAEALAIRPLMASQKMITLMTNPPDIQGDPKEFPFGFNFQASNRAGVEAVAEAAKRNGHTKWAVVSDTTGEFQTYVENLQPLVDPAGAEIVLDQKYDPTTTDFSSIVTKIKQSGADAIFFFAVGAPVQGLLSAVQAAGLKTPIYGGYGLVAADLSSFPDSVLEQAQAPMAKTLLADQDGAPLLEGYADVQERFYEKYGRKPLTGGGGAWDQAQALFWAIEEAGGDDPVKLKEAFESSAANDGIPGLDPEIKYEFSADDHGGYPDSGIGLATLKASKEWPGYYFQATE